MRLLIDLLACQTSSRNRGIGRYSLELAQGLAKIRGDNEVICMADPLFPEGFEELRQKFIRLLPQGGFLPYFHEPIPEGILHNESIFTELATTLICHARQAASPDIILVLSLFEGLDNSQIAVPTPQGETSYKQAVILYDLIPYIFHKNYLDYSPQLTKWYMKRLISLSKFDLLLAISEATRQDAIRLLNISPEKVVNISSAASKIFRKIDITAAERDEVLKRLGIDKSFIFYLGGNDFRKNMEGALQVYSNLPRQLIEQYKLVINEVSDEIIFRSKLRLLGLSDQDVVILGRISDDDLVTLYNLCSVFFFPSIYEGFGLPVLEAMSCGAPVIAANNSSLPELIGRTDILFDVNNLSSAVSILANVLTRIDYRNELSQHGLKKAKEFSWEKTSQIAWRAMRNLIQKPMHRMLVPKVDRAIDRPKIAFLTPLPPHQSGISEYSAELLPHLADFFDIDLFIDPKLEKCNDQRLNSFNIYPWMVLLDRRDEYATVVYQFGNSTFHSHMFGLLEKMPGVVALHDFFLSGLISHLQVQKGNFPQELDRNHGIRSLVDFHLKGFEVIWDWPINWCVLRNAKELIAHSTFQKHLLDQYYKIGWQPHLNIIPQPRAVEPETNPKTRELIRGQLGLPVQGFIICAFGFMGSTKLNELTVKAFYLSRLFLNQNCHLIFVGDCPDKSYYKNIINIVNEHGMSKNVRVTGFVDREDYKRYLLAADISIQLRQRSRGETSRAVLDAMAFGIPVIINAHGTLVDYQDDEVVKIGDPVSIEELSQKILDLEANKDYRMEKSKSARNAIIKRHSPEIAASAYSEVIRSAINSDDRTLFKPAIESFQSIKYKSTVIQSQIHYAALNLALHNRPRILVNVTQLNIADKRTGIERVVKRLIYEFFQINDPSLSIEPVYLSNGGLKRASRVLENILGFPDGTLGPEKELKIHPGDIFVMLDSTWGIYDDFKVLFKNIRLFGGVIITVIYDLIPVYYPSFFPDFLPRIFINWLNSACTESDKLVCISNSVTGEVRKYIIENNIKLPRQVDIKYFHLGADLNIPPKVTPIRDELINLIIDKSSPLFLAVGTLEPRKGHWLILDAFETLWAQGKDYSLVFAGNLGWNVTDLETRIRNHSLLNKNIFFIENPEDAQLEILYSKATALIAASKSEGFGLPIVEAARHQVPALASDIPVFHEVGGDGSIYFSLEPPQSLAQSAQMVAEMSLTERKTLASRVKILTWEESASWLLKLISGNNSSKP